MKQRRYFVQIYKEALLWFRVLQLDASSTVNKSHKIDFVMLLDFEKNKQNLNKLKTTW